MAANLAQQRVLEEPPRFLEEEEDEEEVDAEAGTTACLVWRDVVVGVDSGGGGGQQHETGARGGPVPAPHLSSDQTVRSSRRSTNRGGDSVRLPQRSFSFRERSDSLGCSGPSGSFLLRPHLPAHQPSQHLCMDLEVPEAVRRQNLTVNHSFPDLYDMAGRDKLPRTLSTSALRIKNRSLFWEKFWQGPQQPRISSKL